MHLATGQPQRLGGLAERELPGVGACRRRVAPDPFVRIPVPQRAADVLGELPGLSGGVAVPAVERERNRDRLRPIPAIIAVSPVVGYLTQTLQWYLDNHSSCPFPYQNMTDFATYFVDPIMNIINGTVHRTWIRSRLRTCSPSSVGFQASTVHSGVGRYRASGWQRFEKGAASWVQAMWDAALEQLFNEVVLHTSPATAVWLDPDDQSGQVYVATAQDPNGTAYDKVVLAVDMWTCAELLSCPQNKAYWDNLYSGPLSGQAWSLLQSGTCYIHSDDKVLAPDLLPMSLEVRGVQRR